MAYRDFTKIERTIKDFTLNVEAEGSGKGSTNWYKSSNELAGKHIDIEKFITYLKKLGYTEADTFEGSMDEAICGYYMRSNTSNAHTNFGITLSYDECNGGYIVCLFDGGADINVPSGSPIFEALRENKNNIEATEITIESEGYVFALEVTNEGEVKPASFDDFDFIV